MFAPLIFLSLYFDSTTFNCNASSLNSNCDFRLHRNFHHNFHSRLCFKFKFKLQSFDSDRDRDRPYDFSNSNFRSRFYWPTDNLHFYQNKTFTNLGHMVAINPIRLDARICHCRLGDLFARWLVDPHFTVDLSDHSIMCVWYTRRPSHRQYFVRSIWLSSHEQFVVVALSRTPFTLALLGRRLLWLTVQTLHIGWLYTFGRRIQFTFAALATHTLSSFAHAHINFLFLFVFTFDSCYC